MRLIKQTTLTLSACLFITSQVFAGEVTIPNTFTAGEIAVAADVNANFTEVKTAVDDNNNRLGTLETSGFDYVSYINIDEDTLAVRGDSPEFSEIASVTVVAPADGHIMVTASGYGCIHTANEYVQIILSKSSTAISGIYGNFYSVNAGATNQVCSTGQSTSYSFKYAEPVSVGSTNTYYIIADKGTANDISANLTLSGFSAVFMK